MPRRCGLHGIGVLDAVLTLGADGSSGALLGATKLPVFGKRCGSANSGQEEVHEPTDVVAVSRQIALQDAQVQRTSQGLQLEFRVGLAGEFAPVLIMVASDLSEIAKDARAIRTHPLHCDFSAAVGEWEHCTVGVVLTPTTVPGRL